MPDTEITTAPETTPTAMAAPPGARTVDVMTLVSVVFDLVRAGKIPASLLALALILWQTMPLAKQAIEIWDRSASIASDEAVAAAADRAQREKRVLLLEQSVTSLTSSVGRTDRNMVAICTLLHAPCETPGGPR